SSSTGSIPSESCPAVFGARNAVGFAAQESLSMHRVMQNLVLPLGLLLVGLGSARIACGQGLGELTGTVTDPSGSAIAGAKVVASEAGTGFSRSVSTSAE